MLLRIVRWKLGVVLSLCQNQGVLMKLSHCQLGTLSNISAWLAGKTTLLQILAGKHMVGQDVVRIIGRSAFHDIVRALTPPPPPPPPFSPPFPPWRAVSSSANNLHRVPQAKRGPDTLNSNFSPFRLAAFETPESVLFQGRGGCVSSHSSQGGIVAANTCLKLM